MAGTKKLTKIGIAFVTPELNKGESTFSEAGLQATGGTTTTATFAAGSTVAALYPEGGSASLAADLFNGCYLYFKSTTTTSALQGKAYKITDTVWAADVLTLTTETMASAPVSGDDCYIIGRVAAKDMSVTYGRRNLTRENVIRDTLDKPPSVKGLKEVSGSFSLEPIGLAASLGQGVTHALDVMSHVFEGFGQRTVKEVPAGIAINGTWSTGASGDLDALHGFVVGEDIVVADSSGNNAEISRITNVSTNTITVSPAFSRIPQDNDLVFGYEKYVAYDTGHRSFTIGYMQDDQLVVAKGCVLSLGISGSFGELYDMPIEFDAEDFELVDPAELGGELPANKPIPFISGYANFNDTAICMSSFDFAVNHGREELGDTCEGKEFFITSRETEVSFTARNKDKVLKNTWEENGTEAFLIVQLGNVVANGMAVICNKAQIQDPAAMADNNGIAYHDVSFAPVNDGTDDSVVNAPTIIRF